MGITVNAHMRKAYELVGRALLAWTYLFVFETDIIYFTFLDKLYFIKYNESNTVEVSIFFV